MTIFPILDDEQMSNKVGVEHQPVKIPKDFSCRLGLVFFVFLINIDQLGVCFFLWVLIHLSRFFQGQN